MCVCVCVCVCVELANQKLEARLAQQAATQASNAAAISSSKRRLTYSTHHIKHITVCNRGPFRCVRFSGGKADKSQGRVAPGAARKKPTAPAYAPPASSATGKRQNQPTKETVVPTDKAEKTSVTGGPTNKVF